MQGRDESAAVEGLAQEKKRSALAGEALHDVHVAESADDEHTDIRANRAEDFQRILVFRNVYNFG